MTNSKQKGKRGELELSNLLKTYGFDTHRSQQYCGKTEEAMDVVGLPLIHVECKRNETLNIYSAVEQAQHDNTNPDIYPTVFHRKNGKPWLVTMELSDWMEIYLVYLNALNESFKEDKG